MTMNHLPRFFRNSKKEEKNMDRKQQIKRLKPKLDRRNAMKNIDYDATSSPSSSESSSSSAIRTRSLDFHSYPSRTSFRVEGTEGEFDRICTKLGLSGPEDFAIPAAAWEAMKARSVSDLLPRSKNLLLESQPETPVKAAELGDEVEDGFSVRFASTVRVNDESVQENKPAQLNDCRDLLAVGACGGGGEGIKGARPPVLTPPPSMSLPIYDNMGSTWDILRSFAPEDGRLNCVEGSSSDEEDGEFEDGEVNGAIDEGGEVNGVRLGVTAVLSGSCSFTTSNDDDCSSTTTEPLYNISPNGRFKRNIKSWIRGDLLGSGSFGTVYEGITDDGFFFAVKEVSLLDQGSQGKQSIYQLEQEIALLSQFEHENIVRYLGTDKDEAKLYIFLEYVTKGSLASLYQKYRLLDSQVSAYTRQILNGLKYLHERNVVHRDIKCANILVDASGSVKLADFGLAKATKLNDVNSCKGTAFWMAPEVVNRKSNGYGLAADIWSLGCTILEMLTRQLPYSHLEWMQALFKIGKGKPPRVPNSLSEDARDIILQCLKVNPDERPTAAQLLDHPFVKRPLPASSDSISPPHDKGIRS